MYGSNLGEGQTGVSLSDAQAGAQKLSQEERLPRHEALKDAISVLRSRVEELKSLRDDIRNTPQTPEGVRDSRSLNSLSDILEFGPLEINELTQQINGVLGDLREILL